MAGTRRAGENRRTVAAPRLFGVLLVAACGMTEPATDPADLRATPSDTATVYGQIFAMAPPGAVPTEPVPRPVIELGRWQGGPYAFRDSLRGAVAATPDDDRFRVAARVMAADTGGYRLGGVPRAEIFALRVRPPSHTPYRVTYLGSLFSLRNVTEVRFSVQLERK